MQSFKYNMPLKSPLKHLSIQRTFSWHVYMLAIYINILLNVFSIAHKIICPLNAFLIALTATVIEKLLSGKFVQ